MPRCPIVIFADKDLHQFYEAVLGALNPAELFSCEDAFEWSKRGRAEIAVIDCGYIMEEGLRLLREIKKSSAGTIVVFIAQVSSEETPIQAFTSGARAYLRKPFDVLELQGLLKKFLAVKQESKEKRLNVRTDENHLGKEALEISTSKPVQLLRAFRHMQENLASPLDLGMCAKEAGMSKHHFCRAFKRHFGRTPMQFLRLMRVIRAKDLLAGHDLNLDEIAGRVGFNDYGSFIKAFKKTTGLSPRAYRNSIKK